MKKFCIYTRVSTQKQGRSGLGLEAQMKMCEDFIKSQGGAINEHFSDVESGTHRDRPGLWKAIDYCKAQGATLVIAKLDRLCRDVEFTFKVINEGIDIHFCDMPVVNTMILGVFASVAQYERELTSKRTKDALEACRQRGTRLGNSKGIDLTAAQKASAEARRERARADKNNRILWGILKECQGKYLEYAIKLNTMGMRTASGLEFDYDRVKSTYHNLKRLYEAA